MQLQSFSYPLSLPFLPESSTPYVATFIRAPLIHSILDASSVNVLARLPEEKVPTSATAQTATGGHAAVGPDSNAVLLQQGRLLISSWHPELNKSDHRLHEWWLKDIVLAQ